MTLKRLKNLKWTTPPYRRQGFLLHSMMAF
jgi:hypothetical protein